jgi:hypothetical protein
MGRTRRTDSCATEVEAKIKLPSHKTKARRVKILRFTGSLFRIQVLQKTKKLEKLFQRIETTQRMQRNGCFKSNSKIFPTD